jgi:hypothetical protein
MHQNHSYHELDGFDDDPNAVIDPMKLDRD